MKNLKDYKIDVSGLTETQRAEVQKAAFKLGYEWGAGGRIIQPYNDPYFYFEKTRFMYWDKSKSEFKKQSHTQITPKQLIDMAYKPKPKPKPTKESFTLSDCLTFIIDCQSNGVKVGRDAVRKYCNVTESTARKAVDMVKHGEIITSADLLHIG